LRSCTGQGHSLQCAQQYYRVTEDNRSAYKVVMGDCEPIPPQPLVTASVAHLTPSLPATAASSPHLTGRAAVSSNTRSDAHPNLMSLESTPPPCKKQRTNTWASVAEGVSRILNRASPIQAMAMGASPLGADHPFANRPSARVPASDAERTWLFNYFRQDTHIYDVQRGHIFRSCLDAILVQDSARAVFHERHVQSSDRLKTIALHVIDCVKMHNETGAYPEWYQIDEYAM